MHANQVVRILVLIVWMWPAVALTGEPADGGGKDWDPIPSKVPPPDRYKNYHELVAKAGPHARIVTNLTFGAADPVEFLDGGELPDNTLVIFGNAWGPTFPATPNPVVLGKQPASDSSSSKPATPVTAKGAGKPKNRVDPIEALDGSAPNRAGFLAFYAPQLASLQKVVRFDWGVLSLTDGAVSRDGKGLLVLGRAKAGFHSLGNAGTTIQGEGAVCVLRLTADGGKIEWAWRTDGNPPDQFWQDKAGNIYFDANGLKRISADGKELKKFIDKSRTSTSKWLLVDDVGRAYFGGDRNTHTGKQPWRQPYLYQYDQDGQKQWACWEFNPRDVSSARGGLESDSSVRGLAQRSDGTLIVTGWSDGGNSVFQRWATDWKKNCPDAPLGWSPWWPKGANSYGHVMLFDPLKRETKAHLWWCGYLPVNFEGGPSFGNRTAFQSIRWVVPLSGGAIGFTGVSATGLIQTPGALWKDPGYGKRFGGETCVILNHDLSRILFSSYLPGVIRARPVTTRNGLLVTGTSSEKSAAASVPKGCAFYLALP